MIAVFVRVFCCLVFLLFALIYVCFHRSACLSAWRVVVVVIVRRPLDVPITRLLVSLLSIMDKAEQCRAAVLQAIVGLMYIMDPLFAALFAHSVAVVATWFVHNGRQELLLVPGGSTRSKNTLLDVGSCKMVQHGMIRHDQDRAVILHGSGAVQDALAEE